MAEHERFPVTTLPKRNASNRHEVQKMTRDRDTAVTIKSTKFEKNFMLYRVMVQHRDYFALKLTRKWAALGKVQTSLTLLSLAPSLRYQTN